jgi:hypothetical protein
MSTSGDPPDTMRARATRLESEPLGELSGNRSLTVAKAAFTPDRSVDQRNVRLTLLIAGVSVSALAGGAIVIFHTDLEIDRTSAVRVFAGMLAISVVVLFVGLHRLLIRPRVDRNPIIDRGDLSELTLKEYNMAVAHRARSSWAMVISLYLFWVMLAGGVLVALLAPGGGAKVGGLAVSATLAGMTLFIRSVVTPAYRLADETSRRAGRAHIDAVQRERTMLSNEKDDGEDKVDGPRR